MIKIFLNTTLGIVLVAIWLKFVDIGEILSIISKVEPKSLSLVFIFMFLSPVIRALRLKIFLREVKKLRLLDLIFLNGVAMMLNFFIPIRAGEIAKGIFLNTRYGLPLGKSVVWMFLDRFVDFLVVLILTALLVLIVPSSLSITFISEGKNLFIIVITIIIFISFSLTYLAIYQSNFAKKIINFLKYLLIEKHIKLYFEIFSHFILHTFSILRRHPKDLVLMGGITVLAYGADAFIWYFTFIALGVPQAFIKMYLGQLLSALTYLIPAAPGYVGSAEASGLLILSGVFGVNVNLASAMTVLFHILSVVFVLIFGLVSVYNLKIDMSLILKKVLKRGN